MINRHFLLNYFLLNDFDNPWGKDESAKLIQEFLNSLNASTSHLVRLEISQFLQDCVEMLFDAPREFLEPSLMSTHLSLHLYPSISHLAHLSHVLQHLHDLRHHHDALYDLFEDYRYFNESLLNSSNGHWDLLDTIDDLQDLLDVVDISDYFLQLLCVDQLLHPTFHLYDLSGLTADGHNPLLLPHHFLHGLDDSRHFDHLLHDLLDVLVYSNDLWDYAFHLYQLRHLHQLLPNPLYLMDLGNGDGPFNDFFNDLLGSDYLLNFALDRDEALDDSRNLLDDFLVVGHESFHLHDGLLNEDTFDYPLDLLQLHHFLHHWYQLLNHLRHRDDSLDYLLTRHYLLHDTVHGHWDLVGNDDLSVYLHYFQCLQHLWDDLLDLQVARHFMDEVDGHLPQHFTSDHLLLDPRNLHCTFDHTINGFLDFNVDVLYDLHFLDGFLNDWNVDDPLYLTNDLTDHFLLHYFLDELRHLHYFLYDSRHYHYFLYNLLNFNHTRHFHHLLDYLLYHHSHLFNPIHCCWHLHDLLLDILDGLGYIHVNIHELLHLNYRWLFNDQRFL